MDGKTKRQASKDTRREDREYISDRDDYTLLNGVFVREVADASD